MIRLAIKDDLESIITIEAKCFPEAEAASREQFIERFQVFPEWFIVACDGEKVIGSINGATTDEALLPDQLYRDVSLHKPHGEYQTVFGLSVLPEYRNQGVAGKLLNKMIELSKERGKKGIVLTCKDHLIHYYEKFGFVHQGISESCHGGAQWNDMLLLLYEKEK